jgi:hypothetical protein
VSFVLRDIRGGKLSGNENLDGLGCLSRGKVSYNPYQTLGGAHVPPQD